jgi:hypothetical protein
VEWDERVSLYHPGSPPLHLSTFPSASIFFYLVKLLISLGYSFEEAVHISSYRALAAEHISWRAAMSGLSRQSPQ